MRFRSFWPFVLWTVIILILSFTSGKSFPSSDWMDWFKLDKWVHAFLYFALFVFGFIPITSRQLGAMPAKTIILISYCLFIGVFTELIQAYCLVDRSGDIADMIANALGVIIGFVFVRIFYKNWPWKITNEGTVSSNEETV
ncbi:MAG: VanZ family protein [Flavobacteriales bacterium]|nr:VanZ family protein [Flavobacteriales bacterium]MCB9198448.1 VanZ family protein [Flavobacteriales bacterium]